MNCKPLIEMNVDEKLHKTFKLSCKCGFFLDKEYKEILEIEEEAEEHYLEKWNEEKELKELQQVEVSSGAEDLNEVNPGE